MKSLLAVIGLLVGASLLSAETIPVKTVAPAKTTAPVVPAKPAATTPTTKAKSGAKAKVEATKEAEPIIPGQTIARTNGTFLGLEVVGGNFKLSFYDAKKKPVAPDVTRASARWPNTRGIGDNRAMLNLSGTALVGNKFVAPPLVFNLYITLLQGEGEEATAVENFVVQFRG